MLQALAYIPWKLWRFIKNITRKYQIYGDLSKNMIIDYLS